MIDHTAVNVSDQEAAKSFYAKALEPLGYSLAFEAGDFIGFADANGMDLGVVRRDPVGGAHVASSAMTAQPSTRSMKPHSRPAGTTTDRRVFEPTITSTTTVLSSTTRTGTTSRPSARRRSNRSAEPVSQ